MSLPERRPCKFCQEDVPLAAVRYYGVTQPVPGEAGYHTYIIAVICPTCGARTVSAHYEDTPLDAGQLPGPAGGGA